MNEQVSVRIYYSVSIVCVMCIVIGHSEEQFREYFIVHSISKLDGHANWKLGA